MGQSSENIKNITIKNETCDFFFNCVPMEELSIDYPNLETKINRGLENEQIMKLNLQKQHAQRVERRFDGRNAFCWVYFNVNDNRKVDHTTNNMSFRKSHPKIIN